MPLRLSFGSLRLATEGEKRERPRHGLKEIWEVTQHATLPLLTRRQLLKAPSLKEKRFDLLITSV